jgi:aminopeptidase
MADQRIANLARILVRYSTKVRPKEEVAIYAYSDASIPLVREVYREVLRAGGYPNALIKFEGMDYLTFSEANEDQLSYVPRHVAAAYQEFPVLIAIRGEKNTRSLSNIDPELQAVSARAQEPLLRALSERTAAGTFRWVGTLFPTPAHAQDAEMSLSEFEDFAFGSMYADIEDPIGKWREIHAQQARWVEWLKGKKQVRVQGPDVDLTMSIDGRVFLNADGTNNMPSGEIFTGPVEDSVEGTVRFSFPAVRKGREVQGIELTFERGKVVKASAEKNEAFLLRMLESDEGARYVGEFAIGTNKRINRFVKQILFDEKIGGTIHMALGMGYALTGSENRSAIHWDMICDMRDGGQILIDDELIYDSGEFRI